MNVLIVKLSSLGDVVHAMPAVQDIRRALPAAQIDWVVERGFAPLAARCDGVRRVIPCELRRWRKAPLAASTRAGWRAFRTELQATAYDAVIDLQGLSKSALVAWLARRTPVGRRYALANQTEGSGYEAPTRWVADVALRMEPHIHAVQRSRELCARALAYAVPDSLHFGLLAQASRPLDAMEIEADAAAPRGCVALVHGTSRDDKCWPEDHWLALGRQLLAGGWSLGLPQGSAAERERGQRLADQLGPRARVWPAMDLGALTDRLAACAGVVGVDSGLSHIAVALDLPHVQLYNFDTAWRTGPTGGPRQRSLYGQPTPAVQAVWQAWCEVSA
ncbi:MAG: lipopolysaccharide heptosyltransferase I [Ramlibacter sp.]|nr:lipopolysaccharide heptosyltransferase I [Ramlibacter sp.]